MKVELNGTVRDLTDSQSSDSTSPTRVRREDGKGTLVVYDVAVNSETYTFTSN